MGTPFSSVATRLTTMKFLLSMMSAWACAREDAEAMLQASKIISLDGAHIPHCLKMVGGGGRCQKCEEGYVVTNGLYRGAILSGRQCDLEKFVNFWPHEHAEWASGRIKNCLRCKSSKCQDCGKCEEGYSIVRLAKATRFLCRKCPDNCVSCFSHWCMSCKNGYKLDKVTAEGPRQCKAAAPPVLTPKGQIILPNGGKCMKGDFKILKNMGSGAHTIRAVVTMPTVMPTAHERQWILNLGQEGGGAHIWLWSPTNFHKQGDLQFGRWKPGIDLGRATFEGQVKGVSEGMTHEQMMKAASLTTTFDGKTYNFYIDGELKQTIAINPPFNIKTNNLRVGLQPDRFMWKGKRQQVPFKGCVTKVEVWDSALTSDEVAVIQ